MEIAKRISQSKSIFFGRRNYKTIARRVSNLFARGWERQKAGRVGRDIHLGVFDFDIQL
jgi:hypothetical protein